MAFRAGFVSILGRPNAGKSTLLNALTGEKLAIIARKPQTTRTTIQGVMNLPEAQVVFLDTPGIHKSDTLFNKRMMDAIRSAVQDRDLLLYLVDSSRRPAPEDTEAISILKKPAAAPVFLILNKIDILGNKSVLLERIEQYKALHEFDEYFPVSALKADGLDGLKESITARLPEGEPFFPPDYITDQPERFLVAELIREKILKLTQQEVPHSTAVLVDKWEEGEITRIFATIFVERDGQTRIIIGAGGGILKRIGTEARMEAERILARKIFLELFVKVRPNWREDARFLNEIDWRSMAGT